jgi:AcrR family transcriptional regulator
MPVGEGDLTSYDRIRDAALNGFATRGVRGTSIRAVARAAGVSPGLVQHHFRTKAGLRAAVDEYVRSIAVDAFKDVDAGALEDPVAELGDIITAVVRDHPTALLYVARSVSDGDEAGLAIFTGFVELARAQVQRLDDAGRLHPELDLDWVSLHVVIWPLGTVLFDAAISGSLGRAFRSRAQIERWNLATAHLFREGIYAPRRKPRRRG